MSTIFGRLFLRGNGRKAGRARQRRVGRVEALEPRLALSTIVEDDNWRFEDGGMKDLNTGLVWGTSAIERTNSLWTYNGALNLANELAEGGFSDWRLPTQAEVQEAASHGIGNHAYSQYSGTSGGSPAVWSTDKCNGSGGSRHVLISTYDGSTTCHLDTGAFDTIAVRGIRSLAAHTTPNIRVFSQLLSTKETYVGARFTVALDTQPTANVTIPVSSGDATEGSVSASQLVFTPTNWNVPQGVNVTALGDVYYDPNKTYQAILSAAISTDPAYSGRDASDVTVVNRDKEDYALWAWGTPDVVVSENPDDNNTGFLDIRLTGQPESGGTVYVEVTSLDASEGTVSQSPLTFDASNWDVLQRVTVQGAADGIADGDQPFSVHVSVRADSPAEFLIGKPVPPRVYKCVDMDGLLSTYGSGNVNLAIPDPGTVTSQMVVPAPTDGNDRIGDLNVTLNINHTYDSDITATLISPSGQRIKLLNRNGSSGDNFVNTTLDDEASSGIGGSAPFTGSFRPAEVLSILDGTLVAGTWKLEINDAVRKDKGTLVNWSLNFSRIPEPSAAVQSSEMDVALMMLLTENQTTTRRTK